VTVNRILVAHDFSDPANRALQFAAVLAGPTKAQLELVYVLPDVYDGRGDVSLGLPPSSPFQGERYVRFLEEELQRTLREAAPQLADDARCHVLRGDPVKHIVSLAKQVGADFICVGATGKNAVSRVLLGSVSQSMLRTSTVPVLVVP
jgi:nucleotide-binding universal stress UspA family protein